MRTWRFLLAAPVLLLPAIGSASLLNPIQDRPHGGIVARINQGTLTSGEIPADYVEPTTGFSAGAFGIIPLNPVFGIQLEGVFTRKGGRVAAREDDRYVRETYRFDYFEFAALARPTLPTPWDLQLYGEFGPVLSLTLAGEMDAELSAGSFHQTWTADVTDQLHPLELGVALGGGISIPLTRMGILFGIRHHWGLTNPVDDSRVSLRSRNLIFQTGLYF